MRRAIIVIVVLLILSIAVIAVINLRVKGEIVLPSDTAVAQAPNPAPPIWPSIAPDTTPPQQPPPPRAFDGSATPSAPPEGWIWWGDMAFRKDAKIQGNYEVYSGYLVPVQYMRDGTLVVASKYRDHSACIWSYDTTSGKFAVLHRKTRQAIRYFLDCDEISELGWCETAREYTWERGNPPQRSSKLRQATIYGGARGDQCYNTKRNPIKTEGVFLESRAQNQWALPLNQGALELSQTFSDIGVSIPFLGTDLRMPARYALTISDTATQKVLNSMPSESCFMLDKYWDFGKGLVMLHCLPPYSRPNFRIPVRMALLSYPDLRIVARVDFNMVSFEAMYSLTDGLALDMLETPSSQTAMLFRIRVPNNWQNMRGQKNTACIWEDPPKDLATLELTEQGEFDLAKYDAYESSSAENDPTPENLRPSCAYRDGVMYWRKRHTGEVVMASLSDLDTQTVIGGAGTTWDGFRLNPARNELVTWRENGELVFWNVQFPTADPLYRARVITDETPHRLEAM